MQYSGELSTSLWRGGRIIERTERKPLLFEGFRGAHNNCLPLTGLQYAAAHSRDRLCAPSLLFLDSPRRTIYSLFIYLCSSKVAAPMLCYYSIAPCTCEGGISTNAIYRLERFILV